MSVFNRINRLLGKTVETVQPEQHKAMRKTYDDADCEVMLDQNQSDIERITEDFNNHLGGYLVNQQKPSQRFTMIKQNGIVGIAYHPESDIDVDSCRAYMYQLKSLHTQVGYVQKLALHEEKSGVETMSYYLKPSMRLQNSTPAEQLYGNVTLEIKKVKGNIKHLKCVTTYYSDANYKDVRPWQEWYSVIFLNEQFDL